MAIDAGGERRPGMVDGRLQAMARDYGGDERAASRGGRGTGWRYEREAGWRGHPIPFVLLLPDCAYVGLVE